ncbi:NAD kinase, partial [Nonlabens mediterrranea]|nr:NAD kinase [Nonlabens mediterrranea]
RAVSYIGKLNIPVMGINTGRLGFLATLQSEELELAFDLLFSKKYRLSKRSLITATSKHPENHLAPDNFALNEVTVSRQNTTSMIQIETHLNGELLTSYWADGLIVSTPTGSTGYSLSCGGPVITPDAKALVITPIAPHNLNARPLVIPDDTIITVKVMGRENEFLASLDNRIASYPDETEITLKKADFTIDLIELDHVSFIKTIRHKLLWGEDKRN